MIVEALLLTKHFNSDDLKFWIDWHLNKCKFDRLHIIDNESYIDIPEIIKNEGYGQEIDWWSVGAIFYEMLMGFPPFFSDNSQMTCMILI